MNIEKRRTYLATGLLAVLLGVAASGAAGAHPGGGGGGGGHMGGGGGRFGGGGSHGANVHAVGGARGGVAHFAPAGRSFGGGAVVHGYGGGFRGSAVGGAGIGARGAYGYPGSGYRHGYSTGAHWNGGYWHGGYWPRAYYGWGYAWFLPVLPLAYATYWYGGVPYYYANDVYYTWNPDYDGYTATDPPPVGDGVDAGGSAVAPAAGPGELAGGQIFMYPKNGQSEAQQAEDRRACQQWAAGQAGAGGANGGDYRRAMLACIEGRGYSAN